MDSRPRLGRSFGFSHGWPALLLALVLGTGPMAQVAVQAAPDRGEAPVEEPVARRLKVLATAHEAEQWLAQAIPVGLTLREAPDFFAAADEVFFEPEETLLIFAYRSATAGAWIAWVAFDEDCAGVLHTAAIDL